MSSRNFFSSKKPQNVNLSDGNPDSTNADTNAVGPGTTKTGISAARAARTNLNPGSDTAGIPASDTAAIVAPPCNFSTTMVTIPPRGDYRLRCLKNRHIASVMVRPPRLCRNRLPNRDLCNHHCTPPESNPAYKSQKICS